MKIFLKFVTALFLVTLWFQAITPLAYSQTVPPAFTGLLTGSDDKTILSAWNTNAWYNPAATAGSRYSGPAPGGHMADPIFSTTMYRLPAQTSFPPSGFCATPNIQGVFVDYSKMRTISRDNAYALYTDECGWFQLYSITITAGVPTFTGVRRIQIDSVTNLPATDAIDFLTDSSNSTWANNAAHPHRIYYTGRSANNGPFNTLKYYDADTNSSTVVRNFSAEISGYSGGTTIDNFREGNLTDDDDYFAGCVTDGGSTEFGCLTYKVSTNTVLANKTIGANGICGTNSCGTAGATNPTNPVNWIGFCGDGTTDHKVIINMNTIATRPWLMTRGVGTWGYDESLNIIGIADSFNGHADCGYSVDGVLGYVTTPFSLVHADSAAIAFTPFSAMSVTPPTTGNTVWAGERATGISCLWQFADLGCVTNRSGASNSFTLSMRGSHGTQQGATIFSYFCQNGCPQGAANTGAGGWGAVEADVIMINYSTMSSTTLNTGNLTPIGDAGGPYRITRTHNINSEYYTQSDCVPNWDSTMISCTSSGDVNNGPTPAQPPSSDLDAGQQFHFAGIVPLGLGSPTVVSIAVTPNPASVAVGSTLGMTCTATLSDSTTTACTSPVWSDTNAHSSINTSTGVVTGVSVGSDTITAVASSFTSPGVTVNITALPVGSFKSLGHFTTLGNFKPF